MQYKSDFIQDQSQVNTLQIEQMGNASGLDSKNNLQTLNKKEYTKYFIQTQIKFGQITVYSNVKGQLFIGKEIDLPESLGQYLLKKKLIQQQVQKPETVLPIEHFEFHSVSTVCSHQQKCLLLSKKPDLTLRQIYLQRKNKGQSFRVSEINSIITRIAQALKIQQQSQSFILVDMESIVFLDGKVYILDSLMQEKENFGQSVFGKYRAPETYTGTYNQDEKGSQLLCRLFSLGIIALCLSFLKTNVQSLIYSKNKRKKEVNQFQIQFLLNQLKSQNLTKKLSALLSFLPKIRQQIYELIKQPESRKENDQKKYLSLSRSKVLNFDQNINKQNKINHQFNQRKNHHVTVYQQREALNLRPNTIKNFSNYPNKKTLNQSAFIVVRPPLQDQITKKQQRIIISSKQNQKTNILNRGLSKFQIKQTNQRSIHLPATPKKQRKKQQFSTIKEVTEYDDCFSVSQSKSITTFQGRFQGKIINGKKQGYGVFFFEEGSRYQGQWINNKMHGFGKLFYSGNKLAYEGHWLEGQFHGNGKVFNSEPLILKEQFDFKDFNNLGQEWSSYEGQLQHDKRQGWGILKLSNGERFEGEFKQDMLQGFGSFYTLNNQEIRGIWSESKLIRIQIV